VFCSIYLWRQLSIFTTTHYWHLFRRLLLVWCHLVDYIYVTGFAKTLHTHKIEIYFIAYYNSHTCALSRHSNKTAIDKQVCFYRQTFVNPVKSQRTKTDPVKSLSDINGIAWGPILQFCSMHCTSPWLTPSVWPTVYTTWLAVSTGIINPPTPLYAVPVIM